MVNSYSPLSLVSLIRLHRPMVVGPFRPAMRSGVPEVSGEACSAEAVSSGVAVACAAGAEDSDESEEGVPPQAASEKHSASAVTPEISFFRFIFQDSSQKLPANAGTAAPVPFPWGLVQAPPFLQQVVLYNIRRNFSVARATVYPETGLSRSQCIICRGCGNASGGKEDVSCPYFVRSCCCSSSSAG